MKIQIEPKKETSMEKFTYISYEEYQTAIAKAPKDVRLSDVKDCIQEASADLEYYFMTKNNKGDIIDIEIINDDQPIPLLEGGIEVKTIPKETKVTFQIIDETKMKIEEYLDFDTTIPISSKKTKTLEDVKRTIPDDIQNFLKNGKSIKFFFREEMDNIGFVKKELFLDTAEVPLVESTDGSKVIKCWIMISSDLSKKFKLRQQGVRGPAATIVFLMCIVIDVYLCILIYYSRDTKNDGEGRDIVKDVVWMLLIIPSLLIVNIPILKLIFSFLKMMEFKFLKKYLLK